MASATDGLADIYRLLDTALAHPRGAVHLDLSGPIASATVAAERVNAPHGCDESGAPDPAAISQAREMLGRARRPVILAGLQARDAADALRALATEIACPVLTTYKAKGVVPDSDPLVVGHFTGGTAESACLGAADLILLYGLDPVELIPQPWRYGAPILELGRVAGLPHYATLAVSLIGPLGASAACLHGAARASDWSIDDIEPLRSAMRRRLQTEDEGITAGRIVQTAASRASKRTRITVDAGAHMFSTMALSAR